MGKVAGCGAASARQENMRECFLAGGGELGCSGHRSPSLVPKDLGSTGMALHALTRAWPDGRRKTKEFQQT